MNECVSAQDIIIIAARSGFWKNGVAETKRRATRFTCMPGVRPVMIPRMIPQTIASIRKNNIKN